MARLIRIVADPPWGWCAGLRHPPEAEYPAAMFTPAPLAEMRADPALTLEEVGEVSQSAPGAQPGGAGKAGGADSVAGSDAQAEGAAQSTTPPAGEGQPEHSAVPEAAASNPAASGTDAPAPITPVAPLGDKPARERNRKARA